MKYLPFRSVFRCTYGQWRTQGIWGHPSMGGEGALGAEGLRKSQFVNIININQCVIISTCCRTYPNFTYLFFQFAQNIALVPKKDLCFVEENSEKPE